MRQRWTRTGFVIPWSGQQKGFEATPSRGQRLVVESAVLYGGRLPG
jgi:hypothetical protein